MALTDIFKNFKRKVRQYRYAKLLNGFAPVFSQFGTDIFASDLVQMCIDVIATECSKLQPSHMRVDDEGLKKNVKGSINRLLKIAPNELMTTRDFLEKVIWLLFMNYNAFIYPTYKIRTNNGKKTRYYTGFYPLNPNRVEFLQDSLNRMFVKMYFDNGQDFTLAYSDVIHLRKKFSVNSIMGGGLNGQPDNEALLKVLSIDDTVLQGLGKAIKSSLSIRGILKINTLLDDDKQRKERARFEKAISDSESGILPMDLKGDFINLKVDPKLIDKDTMKFLHDRVLNYFGVSWPILTGDFTDEQYQAFYEKIIEPIIIALGQAFTKTIFTDREIDHGNEIVFYAQKLLFTNIKNKTAVADILGNRGALTNNQLLELFGYPPYPGGDRRFVSLNYVDEKLVNSYQLKKAGMDKGGGKSNEK